MELLEEIRLGIVNIDSQIAEITEELSRVGEDDPRTKNLLRTQLSRYNNDRTSKERLWHSINQDVSLRNEEIRGRILKMKAEIEQMQKLDEIEIKADIIIDYITQQAMEVGLHDD